MAKIILLLSLISIYLSSLSPDKDNAILIKEYEIKCYRGLITYKINNSQSKKYFLLIKNYYISEFALFQDNIELSYETYLDNDYYFPIKSNTILYLVVQTYSEYCLSFKYMDTNYIILKENEEFLHPIVDYRTYIKAVVNNILNKHVILYFQNIDTNFYLYINDKKIKYDDDEVYSFISEDNGANIKLEIPNHKKIVSIKYLSATYSNIYDDTYKCIDNFNTFQSFFINLNKEKPYFLMSFSNKNNELYQDDKLISSRNYIKTYSSLNYKYFILSNNIGCFQIYYLEHDYFRIDKKIKTFNIINSETYEFSIYNSDKNVINLSIYSSQTHFINQLQIEGENQVLKLYNKDNKYYYNFRFSSLESFIHLKIKFDLNLKNYITVNFDINYELEEEKTEYN